MVPLCLGPGLALRPKLKFLSSSLYKTYKNNIKCRPPLWTAKKAHTIWSNILMSYEKISSVMLPPPNISHYPNRQMFL
jgi:hypothetical protein